MNRNLTTQRLSLRPFQPQDLSANSAYYTNSERTDGVGGALPEHKVFERFCSIIGHWTLRGFGRRAIYPDPDAPAVGHVGPMQLTDAPVEMTWTLWSSHWEGKGYASEAVRTVVQNLFRAGWPSILAHVDVGNEKSHAVARRLGAVPTGNTPAPWMPSATQFRFTPEGLA